MTRTGKVESQLDIHQGRLERGVQHDYINDHRNHIVKSVRSDISSTQPSILCSALDAQMS